MKEFDKEQEKQYDSNRIIDMKLLYVAMTRALHDLTVLYNWDITLPLREEVKTKESNDNRKKAR